MRASLGRTVIVKGPAAASNGSDRAPAIITRVWNDQDTQAGPVAVNLTAFTDLDTPKLLGSVLVYETEEAAGDPGTYAVAYWPAKV